MAINKRETKREVKKLLKSGMSKEDIYYELIDKYKNPIETRGIAYTKRIHRDIANVIRYIPSNERLKKYGLFNNIFLIPLLLWGAWYLLLGDFSRLFWPGIFAFIVGFKHTKYYFVFVATGILVICQGFAMSLYAYQDHFSGSSIFLVLLFYALCHPKHKMVMLNLILPYNMFLTLELALNRFKNQQLLVTMPLIML